MHIWIKDLSSIARPLVDLMWKDADFVWQDEHDCAMEQLKMAIISFPALIPINYKSECKVYLAVNSSFHTVRWILSQWLQGWSVMPISVWINWLEWAWELILADDDWALWFILHTMSPPSACCWNCSLGCRDGCTVHLWHAQQPWHPTKCSHQSLDCSHPLIQLQAHSHPHWEAPWPQWSFKVQTYPRWRQCQRGVGQWHSLPQHLAWHMEWALSSAHQQINKGFSGHQGGEYPAWWANVPTSIQ